MNAAASKARASDYPGLVLEVEELVDYCWRPSCRAEFRRAAAGQGRRQKYCSEICRRAAEKELRQAQSRLAHFEKLVQKLRVDVAAYGKPDDEIGGDSRSLPVNAQERAEDAVRRVEGTLVFANQDDRAVQELQALYDAVAPIILADRMSS